MNIMAKYCPEYGAELKEDNKFCGKCGYRNPQEAQIATERKLWRE